MKKLRAATTTAWEPSPAFLRAQQDPGKLILHEREIESLTVYEWSENGVQQNAFGDQQVAVPADAAKIELQMYNFPTGQLRKIYFPKGTRTPWHPNHDDIILYGLDAHQVEFVGNQTFHSRPGDATLHPSGVDHHSETLAAGTRVEFAFEAQHRSGRDLVALPCADMQLHELTEWVSKGERRVVFGRKVPGKARGSRYRARMFCFPAYTMLELHLPKGQTLPRHSNAIEKLFYVRSGKLRVTTDRSTAVVTAGAMVRMVAGKKFEREALAASVILELEASKTPRPYPRPD
jgi:quercetin dioxygenase-like cupin family protein